VAHQPVELDPERYVDNNDEVIGVRQPVLGDERHIVNDDRARPSRLLELAHPGTDPRMDYRVERGQLLLVGEDNVAKVGPVQRTIRADYVGTEGIDNRRKSIGTGRYDFTRDEVRVDDDGTLGR
jgi:hypothetical protein